MGFLNQTMSVPANRHVSTRDPGRRGLIALDVLPALVDPVWDTSAVFDEAMTGAIPRKLRA